MTETKEMMDAWHRLQQMAADDPAAVSAMTRHLAAFGLMVAGKRSRDTAAPEPILQTGFRMQVGQRDLLMAAAARLDRDVVHLAFDHDEPDRPHGIAIVRLEGEHVVCYSRNALWSATGSRRAAIVCLDQGPRCHFSFRQGGRLAKIDGWPAEDVEPGIRRAAGRLHRLAASHDLRDAHVGAFRELVQFNKPGDWTVRTDRIAA